MTVAISVRGLNVVRGGVPVLREVTLDLPAGGIAGLLGPSGCDKTTLMRAIVGVQRIATAHVAEAIQYRRRGIED
ncbi:MAG: ATP-binding cassette domain-containing protein [Dehalococcoidia bacterium]|nr:ATP-binding cassette domain-containing protein [Dehalococcoidia bacterium]